MKKIKILFFIILSSLQLQAQMDSNRIKRIDSLKTQLSLTKVDSVRLGIYNDLGNLYYQVKLDSALFYMKEAELLCKKNNLKLERTEFLTSIGIVYMIKKEYAKSLKIFLEIETLLNEKKIENLISNNVKKEYKQFNNKETIEIFKAYNIFMTGQLYGTVGNSKKEIKNYLETKVIYEKYNAFQLLRVINMNLATYYVTNKEYEKAKPILNELQIQLKNNSKDQFLKYVWHLYGKVYYDEKKYTLASKNFKKGVEFTTQIGSIRGLCSVLKSQSDLYYTLKQYDSSFVVSKKLLKNSIEFNLIESTIHGYKILSKNFVAIKKFDSAYYYSSKAIILEDSITKSDKESIDKFQNALLDENLKNRDIEINRVAKVNNRNLILLFFILGIFSLIIFLLYRNNRLKQKSNLILNTTLSNLKATQTQLIQSEKMASLGELTAGIAHEIQNPLNFVNNFAEVSNEMIQEIKEERKKSKEERDETLENELLEDISNNLEKINHHGKRADAIVKGMLQHSRSSSSVKEPTDLNALCDEYLRLSYHGLRAKNKSFNATIKIDFDEAIGIVKIIPQDFGRVILNLLTNAFYVVDEKKQSNIEGYEPTVSIATKKENDKIIITVTDNGNGMPQHIIDKIFQPFFTTKPTGKGTGLGLSMSYDIITKGHNGELKVASTENEGTTFSIIITN